MTRARREAVDAAYEAVLRPGYRAESHAGLLLDRGLRDHGKENGETHGAQLIGQVAQFRAGALYRAAYRRWEALLRGRAMLLAVEMEARPALIVGLGGAGVLETAITLNHTYGTPFIPGSALKGLARRFFAQARQANGALLQPAATGDYERVLFGTPDSAGYTVFYDAWYVPGSAPDDRPLQRDVITVHHPRYYAGGANRCAPWDFDDPNPVPFVSARGCYLVAVDGPTVAWSHFALELLTRALADEGAGGKTSSGYGRLFPTDRGINYPDTAPSSPRVAQAVARPTGSHPLVAQIEALTLANVAPQIDAFVQRWRAMPESETKAQVAHAIRAKAEAKGRQWMVGRTWYPELERYLADQGEKE